MPRKKDPANEPYVQVGEDCRRLLDHYGTCLTCYLVEDAIRIPISQYDGPPLPADLMLYDQQGRQLGVASVLAPKRVAVSA